MNNFNTAAASNAAIKEEYSLLDAIVEQSRIARTDDEHGRAKSLIGELAKEVMAGTITVSENMTLARLVLFLSGNSVKFLNQNPHAEYN